MKRSCFLISVVAFLFLTPVGRLGTSCLGLGEQCSSSAECCSGTCTDNKCCLGIQQACTANNECCTMICDPVYNNCADCLPSGRSCSSNT